MMMIFTDTQRMMLEYQAKRLLSDLIIAIGLQQKEEWNVGRIMKDFEEVCSMGRLIALDEVCSTPWEYLSLPIVTDAARNDAEMNQVAAQGWDLHMASSGWLFWRRRKAVREIEAQQ